MSDRISATEVFGDAFQILLKEKEVFLLLGSLLAILQLVWMWPFMDVYFESYKTLLTNPEDYFKTQQQAFEPEEMYYFLYSFPIYFILFMVPTVIWARIVVGGRASALRDGLRPLFKRVLWAFWRNLCAIGWMLLFGVIGGLLIGLLSTGLVYGGMGLTGPIIFLFILFYIAFFIGLAFLMVIMQTAVACEAHDIRLPIYKSFQLLKGNLWRTAGFLMLAWMVFLTIYFMIAGMLFSIFINAPTWGFILLEFNLLLLGSMFNFLIIGYGALLAIKLVPELQK